MSHKYHLLLFQNTIRGFTFIHHEWGLCSSRSYYLRNIIECFIVLLPSLAANLVFLCEYCFTGVSLVSVRKLLHVLDSFIIS